MPEEKKVLMKAEQTVRLFHEMEMMMKLFILQSKAFTRKNKVWVVSKYFGIINLETSENIII